MGAFIAPIKAVNYDENGLIVDSSDVNEPSFISLQDTSCTYNSVTLQWVGGKNCNKFNVYRATSENGKYHLLDTVSGHTYTAKRLTTNKEYFFKVRGCGDFGKIESFTIASTPRLNDIPIVKLKNNQLTWCDIAGAHGYAIYKAKDDGTYRKLGTTKTTAYGAKKGHKYKVRAYRKVNGKYVYSSYTKSVKG